MPAKRPMHLPEQFAPQLIASEATEAAQPAVMLDLIRFVARTIVTINANGKKMDKKCLLCATARLHKEKCRHDAIWALAK